MNSYWIDSTRNSEPNKPINNNYIADVCIVGAGICGLTTGYYLSKKGLKVIIVDKDNIGEKASGNTTAKITFQHGLIYDYLIESFGMDFAIGYLESNKDAISNIKEIIDNENIDCDFEYQSNYVYTTKQDELTKINNEVKALNTLSNYLPKSRNKNENYENLARFVTDCELPFKIAGGIEVQNQAGFHPRKYMLGLANCIQNNGGLIFTKSVVNDVKKDEDGYITFVNNYTIKSKYTVIASHYPFINFPGFYFSKMYQVTSYAIGVETDKELFNGMYINTKEPTFSFRTAKYNEKKLLIIAGGNHKTGYSPESKESYGYDLLEKEAKRLYPDCNIIYKWNTRDCVSLDKVPYIGEFSTVYPNMFVATGFNKWGMTSSNVAANIIIDSILGKENKYAKIYEATRLKPIKNKEELGNMVSQVFKSFVSNRIKIPKENISAIKNDNGGIIKIDGASVGIYKDKDGQIFAISPTCTHLGCLLTWNNTDKTWDCPCHGSRFDYTGKNIYDPAFKDLNKYEIE